MSETISTGTELVQVRFTVAATPATFGLATTKYMFGPLWACVQLLVTNLVFRLRCGAMRWTSEWVSLWHSLMARMLGTLNIRLMLQVLSNPINILLYAVTLPFPSPARDVGFV